LDGARLLAVRISTRSPRGATFNIVGPRHFGDGDVGPKAQADVDDRASNNIENGTAAARVLSSRALECLEAGKDVSENS
jgi:hypothetical protein